MHFLPVFFQCFFFFLQILLLLWLGKLSWYKSFVKQYGRNKSPVIYNCLEKVRVVGKLQNHFWCFAVFGLMLRFFFTCSFSPSLISLSLSLLMIVKKLWMASAFCLHLPITSQLLSSLTLSLSHPPPYFFNFLSLSTGLLIFRE